MQPIYFFSFGLQRESFGQFLQHIMYNTDLLTVLLPDELVEARMTHNVEAVCLCIYAVPDDIKAFVELAIGMHNDPIGHTGRSHLVGALRAHLLP
jgi:hypothetical protein